MEWLENAVIVGGLTGVMLLWVACVAGMLQVAWSTVGDHLLSALKRLKRR
jgi:hypothetical protein